MVTIINFGSKKTPLIANVVASCGKENRIVNWDECAVDDLKSSTKLIFSGSPTMFTKADCGPYISKFSFIKNGQIPVLAICFGHQLLGILHGATIFRGEEVRTENKIRVLKKDTLFDGLFPTCEMKEDHTEGISLPAGFIHLATSASYTNEGMRHPTLPLWGVQFHPEISGANGEKLIGNFLR